MQFPLSALALMLITSSAPAAPAPWYWWQSTSTGERICAQIIAGQWQQVGGPFEDSRCAAPITPAVKSRRQSEQASHPRKDVMKP